MSRNMELRSHLVKVELDNRENLLEALISISDCDCDFNGENGLEYLRDEVWEANGYKDYDDFADKHPDVEEEVELKYESNMEYLVDEVRGIEDDEECIEAYIEGWMGSDGYYGEYEWNCLKNDDGKIIALSVVYMCG